MHVDFTDSLEAVIKTNSEITVSIIESIYVFYIYPTVKTSISKHLTTICVLSVLRFIVKFMVPLASCPRRCGLFRH